MNLKIHIKLDHLRGIISETLFFYYLRNNIIPLFKKGSQICCSNYRPISLLSNFNKLLERQMYNRLIIFLEKSEMFYSEQFGFRFEHSTDHAVLCRIDKI